MLGLDILGLGVNLVHVSIQKISLLGNGDNTTPGIPCRAKCFSKFTDGFCQGIVGDDHICPDICYQGVSMHGASGLCHQHAEQVHKAVFEVNAARGA